MKSDFQASRPEMLPAAGRAKTASCRIFFLTALLLLSAGGFLLFTLPQRSYSEQENRYLNRFEVPAFSAFLDTSMQKNITDSANDQFAGRDAWMKLATGLQRAAGFQDMGGVYFGRNGYYFERILDSSLSQKRYEDNLHYLEQFARENPKTRTAFFPVPPKHSIMTQELPPNAVFFDENRLYSLAASMLQEAALLDIRQEFLSFSGNRPLYFKTDHHWTMDAAYTAYAFWCRTHGETDLPLAGFQPECASRCFYGTLYSKAPDFSAQPDSFFLPSNLPDARVFVNSEKTVSIYDRSRLESKDKYAVYFGGNFGRIDIYPEESSQADRTLLIIKDSFANSLVPFLLSHYSQITMLDFRYCNRPLSELMQEIHPDETLVLYEISNFAQDRDFFKILK
ncbi:MAG: hypothetical protein HFH32_08075 [Eubacterium sp.]|jgi:hypothetical protein|nr:hypothetical protein [Eubacterium sp.]